jgi:hypothetical protein
MEIIKWPSIDAFKYAHQYIRYGDFIGESIDYLSKIKLDGKNAAIQIRDNEVGYQSRNRMLTPDSDNAGFAAWASQYEEQWRSCGNAFDNETVIIYGEWFGDRMTKNVACSRVEGKHFAVFAVQLFTASSSVRLVYPGSIAARLPSIPNLHVLPIFGRYTIDENNLTEIASLIEKQVEDIDKCDPWVQSTFGIEGPGEGLVFYPTSHYDPRLLFKVKGKAHRVNKVRKVMDVNPEELATVEAFVDAFLTPARLAQALAELEAGSPLTVRDTGEFVQWVLQDIKKESTLEVKANGLSWNKLAKAIAPRAVTFFHSVLVSSESP